MALIFRCSVWIRPLCGSHEVSEFQSRPRVVADERAAMVTRVGGCAARTCARDSAWEMTRACASALGVDGKTRSPRGEREFKKHALKRARSRVTSPRRRPSPRCTWKSANSKLRGVLGQTSASSRLWREKTKKKDEMLAQVASDLWSNYELPTNCARVQQIISLSLESPHHHRQSPPHRRGTRQQSQTHS